jgi:hypothetical protein
VVKSKEPPKDAAKFLATMIAISLSIFTAVIKAAGLSIIVWTGRVAFFVLFPFRYRCVGTSVKSIKAVHARIVRIKWILLILSTFLFFAALCILVVRLL